MSDSDDTDELLLIPPDFFAVQSDLGNIIENDDPYFSVVDSLITQVNNLERRINSISDLNNSCMSLPIDDNPNTLMSNLNNNKYSSFEEVKKPLSGYWSTQSTPTKYKEKAIENYLNSNEPNQEEKSSLKYYHLSPRPLKQKEKTNNKVLSEVDNFIKCVQNIQKLEESKCLERDVDDYVPSPKKLQRKLFASNGTEFYNKVQEWQGNSSQLPQKFDQASQRSIPKEIKKDEVIALHNYDSQLFTNSSKTNTTSDLVSSSERNEKLLSTPPKNVQNIPKVISSLGSSNYPPNSFGDGLKTNFKDCPKLTSRLAFLSLHDLWNINLEDFSESDTILLKKLEEEKLMRKYCEDLIQKQQKRILNMQEQIAVAVQVDQAKDEAIESFFDEWFCLQNKIRSLESDYLNLQNKMETVEEEKRVSRMESQDKLRSLEDEAFKALMMAQNSQEKVVNLEKQVSDLRHELENSEEKMNNTEVLLTTEKNKNQQLVDILAEKEREFSEHKKLSVLSKNELEQNQKTVEKYQEELLITKTRLTDLQRQLSDEREWNKEFEIQKDKLFKEIQSHRKMEFNLKDEIKKLKESNEKTKLELKNFYQKQVEIVVRDKLKEFQEQLQKAESNLQFELKAQEKSFAKAAATHIYQITEKHNMEIKLLEERHEEEIRLHKLQLTQASQQLESTKAKLQRQQDRIVEQLYKAMESQWVEALKVIGMDNNTPILPEKTIGDQLNFLKSTSYNSFERILTQNVNQVLANDNVNQMENVMVEEEISQTPLSSRSLKSKQEIENELQKFIQNLSRKTFRPNDDQQKNNEKENNDQFQDPKSVQCKSSLKDSKHLKRPWK